MNRRRGIILYGPPAAGKDTVTRALQELDPRYELFSRMKLGSGKSAGYRMGTLSQLAELEAAGDVIYRNDRYGNVYVVDRLGLDAAFASGVPVLHLGQVAGIEAVLADYPADWITVLLWCSREQTAARSAGRGDSDTGDRLSTWDATKADIDAHPDQKWNVSLDTNELSPQEAAGYISAALSLHS
ncbi:guanylate kinase [Kitasatospora sp. GAS1066B]|uniref:guanylate kinase n=1 Tax=Kitasatospora sp. GAS1066B TaxID=3156271 RepID=UPI0035112F78